MSAVAMEKQGAYCKPISGILEDDFRKVVS
jgi:hypothetical protein